MEGIKVEEAQSKKRSKVVYFANTPIWNKLTLIILMQYTSNFHEFTLIIVLYECDLFEILNRKY